MDNFNLIEDGGCVYAAESAGVDAPRVAKGCRSYNNTFRGTASGYMTISHSDKPYYSCGEPSCTGPTYQYHEMVDSLILGKVTCSSGGLVHETLVGSGGHLFLGTGSAAWIEILDQGSLGAAGAGSCSNLKLRGGAHVGFSVFQLWQVGISVATIDSVSAQGFSGKIDGLQMSGRVEVNYGLMHNTVLHEGNIYASNQTIMRDTLIADRGWIGPDSGCSAIRTIIAGGSLFCDSGASVSDVKLYNGSVKIYGTGDGMVVSGGRLEVRGAVKNIALYGGSASLHTPAENLVIHRGGSATCWTADNAENWRVAGQLSASGAIKSGDITLLLDEGSCGKVMLSGFTRMANCRFSLSAGTRVVSGHYILTDRTNSFSALVLTVNGSTHVLEKDKMLSLGDVDLLLTGKSYQTVLDITGRFTSLTGWLSGNDYTVVAENCRVKSIIAGAAEDVAGNVTGTVNLLAAASPCNIYGGGNNVNVSGKIDLALTGGGYTGIIYGGSRAYAKFVTVHDVAVSVGGIVHSDNQKLIAAGKGNSAWIVGGGVADNAQTLTAGAVNITLDGANIVRVVGGAQAQNAGSLATAASVNITVRNSTLVGDLFGGGYAYNGGISLVDGDVAITIDTSDTNVTVMGNIYGGGANPSYYSKGGSTLVEGGSTVTFTGLGEKLTVGTVSGDGMIAGTVAGIRTLEFRDFHGEFSANVKNFDLLKFAGTSEITAGPGYRANTFKFDLTGRDSGYRDTAVIQDAAAFTFADGDKLLKIELGATSGNYDLMAVDDAAMLDGLKVELFKKDALLCSFNYGETKDGYALEFADGMLSLTRG